MSDMKYFLILLFFVVSFGIFAQAVDVDNSDDRKKALKIEFFAPLTGNLTFGYESYLKDWKSWELKVGIIGFGSDANHRYESPFGFFVRVGPKFKLNPDFAEEGTRGVDLLGGSYIRPELIFSTYRGRETEYNFYGGGRKAIGKREQLTSVALLINYGKQHIIFNKMLLDYNVGLGYGSGSGGDDYYYSHQVGDSSFPIAISCGLALGILLN